MKRREWRKRLGPLVTPMLDCMGTRGPDSAGLAVFHGPLAGGLRRFSLFSGSTLTPGPSPGGRGETESGGIEWDDFAASLLEYPGGSVPKPELGNEVERELVNEVEAIANHAAVVSSLAPAEFKAWLKAAYPALHLLSVGRSIDVYKDEGHPAEIAARYRFSELEGTHAVGHTRMATESAVSPAHAHPFTAGEDFCLVHNGSLSNPYSVRRKLERLGISFETDNDTEAGCRFLEWRMREGDTLEAAIEKSFGELDGFFTFLMATADKMVLVRDAFACKPAVVAETDAYVAVGSEFRSLAHLPDIKQANVFEPVPEQIYSWPVDG